MQGRSKESDKGEDIKPRKKEVWKSRRGDLITKEVKRRVEVKEEKKRIQENGE